MKVVIVGGGYAGLACAAKLSQTKNCRVYLIDKKPYFIDTIQIHKSVKQPLQNFITNYQQLKIAQRFHFIQAKLEFDAQKLAQWAQQKYITCDAQNGAAKIDFDYLALATGTRTPFTRFSFDEHNAKNFVTLEDIKQNGAQYFLQRLANTASEQNNAHKSAAIQARAKKTNCIPRISVIGGGASAMQFLFELEHWRRQNKKHKYELCSIHNGAKLLTNFPGAFHDYCYKKIQRANIRYYPQHEVIASTNGGQLRCRDAQNQQEVMLSSDLTFFLTGIAAQPFALYCDAYGRVYCQTTMQTNIKKASSDMSNADASNSNAVWQHVFAAGDCAFYDQSVGGWHAPSAQVALRKGRLVADNIIRQERGQRLWRYLYPGLGAFVSLGDWDGIAWLFVHFNILRGAMAFGAKEIIEKQFRLLLADLDTYIDL